MLVILVLFEVAVEIEQVEAAACLVSVVHVAFFIFD